MRMRTYTRLERTEDRAAAEQHTSAGQGARAITAELGVARSTLQVRELTPI